MKNSDISISHGEYFNAVRAFFENDGFEVICRALSQCYRQKTKPENLREIRICLEKHGEFYHPARIIAANDHQKVSFVLNLAVSQSGLRHINKEYECLKKLNNEFKSSFLPRFYGFGEVRIAGNRKLRMFLGDWFEDYHEFHLSNDPSDHKNKILIWDDAAIPFYLSDEQSADLYRQIATILTYYYKVESFEQIFPWHHAAGDFVVRANSAGLDVRLITVRNYAPLFKNSTDFESSTSDIELILQSLLIFFLNLSIRMRLDRLDGVGDIVWADKTAVYSTLAGFIEGLSLKPSIKYLPDSIEHCFMYYISNCSKKDLYELNTDVITSFNPHGPELSVVKHHLSEHVETLDQAIGDMLGR